MYPIVLLLCVTLVSLTTASPLMPNSINQIADSWIQATPDVKYLTSCKVTETWFNAFLICKSMGGQLAAVTSSEEEQALETILAISHTFTDCPLSTPWLGLVENGNNRFLWASGILGLSNATALFSNWKSGQPQLSSSGDLCGQLDMASNKWYTTRCVDKNTFVCEKRDDNAPEHKFKTALKKELGLIAEEESTTVSTVQSTDAVKTTPKPATTTTPNRCPAYGAGHWFQQSPQTNDTSCYYFSCSGTSYDFFSAQIICEFFGGNLISIHDSEMINFIFQTSKAHCINSGGVYIGLFNDDGERHYLWSDTSEVDFTNWDDHDSENGQELCAEQQAFDNRWSQISCSQGKRFICRVPPNF